jgi:hypothetical protein
MNQVSTSRGEPHRDPLTGKRRNLTGTARTKREAQALRANW